MIFSLENTLVRVPGWREGPVQSHGAGRGFDHSGNRKEARGAGHREGRWAVFEPMGPRPPWRGRLRERGVGAVLMQANCCCPHLRRAFGRLSNFLFLSQILIF